MFKHLIEFILVDFGSQDGLFDWIKENHVEDLQDGYLKYFYTDQMIDWHASIAKNTSHRLASNDILVNLDCDNFTGLNGGKIIIQKFLKYGPKLVLHQFSSNYQDGTYGRISLYRERFFRIGGYDEHFEPMGYQDVDLLARLNQTGSKYQQFSDPTYNRCICNSKEDSVINTKSQLTWQEMNIKNHNLSKANTENFRFIANQDKKTFGITQNIFFYNELIALKLRL